MRKFLLLILLAVGLCSQYVLAQTSPTIRVNSIAELVAVKIPTITSQFSAIVAGYYNSTNSGPTRTFIYNAESTLATNRCRVFKPLVGNGRWIDTDTGPINVLCCGAKADGVANDTVYIQNALDVASTNAAIYCPSGNYSITQVTINRPIKFYGDGRPTALIPATTNFVVNITKGTQVNPEGQNFNVKLSDFSILSDGVSVRRGIYAKWLDSSVFENLFIDNLNGQGIRFENPVRESSIISVFVRRCGNVALGAAAVEIEDLNALEDASNNLYFENCFFVYNNPESVKVYGVGDLGVRGPDRIFIHQCMFHGLLPSAGSADLLQLAASYFSNISGNYFTQQGLHRSAIQLGNDAGTTAAVGTHISGNQIIDYNSTDPTSGGYGIRVRSGSYATMDNNTIANQRDELIKFDDTVNGFNTVGVNNIFTGMQLSGIQDSASNLLKGGVYYANVYGNGKYIWDLQQIKFLTSDTNSLILAARTGDTNFRLRIWDDHMFMSSGSSAEFVNINWQTLGILGIQTPKILQQGLVEIDTNAIAPASSGSAANYFLRMRDDTGGSGSRVLDYGVGPSYGWIQSRDKNDYSVKYDLQLNPTGGNVKTFGNFYPLNGQVLKRGASTAPYQLLNTDFYVKMTSSGNATLPDASDVGSGAVIALKSESGVTTTVIPSSGDTVEGGSSFTIGSLASCFFISDGVNNWEALYYVGAVISQDVVIGVAGNGMKIKEGSNARMGTVTLVGGESTVANTSVTANTRIFLTSQVDGGTPGWLRVDTRTASTSFHIQSSSGTDTSTVAWILFEPSP